MLRCLPCWWAERPNACADITQIGPAGPLTTDDEGSAAQETAGRDPALDRELKLELPKEIKRARELGDLRENAEYHAAKERQTYVAGADLDAAEARRAICAHQPRQDPARQGRLRLDRAPARRPGATVVFQLVMPEDADAEKGLISTSSPIGRAIVGKEPGDEVKVVTPNGKRIFEIVKLVTIHDSLAEPERRAPHVFSRIDAPRSC